MKTYYQILGVLDDADEVVIRAAYKALAQKYHPDKWYGSKDEANARMAEINEAYENLIDPIKRARYDETIDRSRYEEESYDSEDDLIKNLDENWNKVIEYLPALVVTVNELSRLSKSLEYAFKLTLLETKRFDDSDEIAQNLQSGFLTKYFGTNKEIQSFAKSLILDGQKRAAKELNRAVVLLGSRVDPKVIIGKITGELKEGERGVRCLQLAELLIQTKAYRPAEELMLNLGASVRDKGFLGSNVEVSYKGQTHILSLTEFIEYASNIANDLLQRD